MQQLPYTRRYHATAGLLNMPHTSLKTPTLLQPVTHQHLLIVAYLVHRIKFGTRTESQINVRSVRKKCSKRRNVQWRSLSVSSIYHIGRLELVEVSITVRMSNAIMVPPSNRIVLTSDRMVRASDIMVRPSDIIAGLLLGCVWGRYWRIEVRLQRYPCVMHQSRNVWMSYEEMVMSRFQASFVNVAYYGMVQNCDWQCFYEAQLSCFRLDGTKQIYLQC